MGCLHPLRWREAPRAGGGTGLGRDSRASLTVDGRQAEED